MPIETPPGQAPRQSNRDYASERKYGRIGASMVRIGGSLARGAEGVFREVTKPGPRGGHAGVKTAEGEYGIISRAGGEMELEKALRFLDPTLTPVQKKAAEAKLRTLARPILRREGITPAKVAQAQEDLEGLIGKRETADVMKSLQGVFEIRKEVSVGEVEKRIRARTRNLEPWKRALAAEYVGGFDNKKAQLSKRKKAIVSHEHIAQTAAYLGKTHGKFAGTRFARPFHPVEQEGQGVQGKVRSGERVGLMEGLFGGKRRRIKKFNTTKI